MALRLTSAFHPLLTFDAPREGTVGSILARGRPLLRGGYVASCSSVCVWSTGGVRPAEARQAKASKRLGAPRAATSGVGVDGHLRHVCSRTARMGIVPPGRLLSVRFPPLADLEVRAPASAVLPVIPRASAGSCAPLKLIESYAGSRTLRARGGSAERPPPRCPGLREASDTWRRAEGSEIDQVAGKLMSFVLVESRRGSSRERSTRAYRWLRARPRRLAS